MLIGLGNTKPASAAKPESADIYSVSTQEFETKIVAESQKRPVLIDFWAPWCGPCKQLMPVLEELVNSKQGKIALAKVNIDENPELAQAFRVQSVPTVIALFMGQPVTGFQGVRPRAEMDHILNQLIEMHRQQQPDALDIPAVLTEAAGLMNDNNFSMAQNLYSEVLAQDPLNAQAYAGIIRIQIANDNIDEAQAISKSLPEQINKDPHIISVRTALELAAQRPAGKASELEKKLGQNPDDPSLLFEYAEILFADGEREKAADALLAIIGKNRNWEDDKARKQLIKYFEAWGHGDPASVAGRRKLSSLLFS